MLADRIACVILFFFRLRDSSGNLQFILSGFTLILKVLMQKYEAFNRGNALKMPVGSKSMKVATIKYEKANRRTLIKGIFKQLPEDAIFRA